jgi:hypothetical protein
MRVEGDYSHCRRERYRLAAETLKATTEIGAGYSRCKETQTAKGGRMVIGEMAFSPRRICVRKRKRLWKGVSDDPAIDSETDDMEDSASRRDPAIAATGIDVIGDRAVTGRSRVLG